MFIDSDREKLKMNDCMASKKSLHHVSLSGRWCACEERCVCEENEHEILTYTSVQNERTYTEV